MQQQQQHQDEFMADDVVGIERWNGSRVRIAHKEVVAKPDLAYIHFDAITEDSIATWAEMALPQYFIDQAMQHGIPLVIGILVTCYHRQLIIWFNRSVSPSQPSFSFSNQRLPSSC
jgi:hypothetical protein